MKGYLVETTRKDDELNKFVSKEGNLYIYYSAAFSRLNRLNEDDKYYFTNKLAAYVFDNYGVKFEYQKLMQIFGNNISQNEKEYKGNIEWFCETLENLPFPNKYWSLAKYGSIPFEISDFKIREIALTELPENEQHKYKKYDLVVNKIKSLDKILVSLKYNVIHTFLVRGNQYSTFTEDLIRGGLYDIEVFGSAFNSRLPRYGHIYTGQTPFERNLEKPFGGLGSFDEVFEGIINGSIQTRGILVSPPSPKSLHARTIEYIRRLSVLKKGINVCLAISMSKFNLMNGLDLLATKKKKITEAFLFLADGKIVTVPLSGDWCEFYFYF